MTSKQVGGTHYNSMKIEPIKFIVENDIPYREGNAIKYICRHKNKNGAEDIKKAIHYLEMILETEYNGEDLSTGHRDGPEYRLRVAMLEDERRRKSNHPKFSYSFLCS